MRRLAVVVAVDLALAELAAQVRPGARLVQELPAPVLAMAQVPEGLVLATEKGPVLVPMAR